MKQQKRSKSQIYFDILRLLCEESKNCDKPSSTRVAHRANLPYDRFRSYLSDLAEIGMVSEGNPKLVVTEKGFKYVIEYERMSTFLKDMGVIR